MTQINLKIPYTQNVEIIKLKPKSLLFFISDNMSPFEATYAVSPKVKVYIPQDKLVFGKYVSEIPKEFKNLVTRSTNYARSLKPFIYDGNSLLYKLNNIMFKDRNKVNAKYIDSLYNILNIDRVKTLESFGYNYIALQYGIDVTKFSNPLTKGDFKNLILGALFVMNKSPKYNIPFKRIILTIKLNNSFYSYLVYDGKKIEYDRILKIINNFIKLANMDTDTEDTFSETEVRTLATRVVKQSVKNYKLSTDEEVEYAEYAVERYLEKHPELVADQNKIDKKSLVKDAILEISEEQEFKISGDNVKKLINQLIESVPQPIKVKPQTAFEKVFNDEIKTGNTLNLRREMFEKNLIDQVKVFGKYYTEKYDMNINKIKINKAKTKSVFNTTYSEVIITLKDKKTGKKFDVKVNLPDLTDKNYIKYDGIKRVLVYQVYRYPIVQPMPFTSMIKTNYTSMEFKVKSINKNKGIKVYIAGKEISAISLLASINFDCDKPDNCKKNCFEYSLKQLKAKYKTSDDKELLKKQKFSFMFDNKVYYVEENADVKTQQLFWAFKQEFKKHEIKNCNDFKETFIRMYGNKYFESIRQVNNYIIDPITEYVLISENKSTNTIDLYNECIDNAITGVITDPTSLNNKRVRSSESLAILMFKKITPAIHDYRTKNTNKIHVNSDAVINDLMAGDAQSQFQMVNDRNPLIEVSTSDMITHGGYGGISTEFAKTEIRMSDDTYYGNIDPVHTPDSQAVGVVRHLAINSDIENATGKFGIRSTKELINPFSLGNNFNPGTVHNDGNRIQYGVAQSQSDIPIINSELPYISSKYSSLFPRLVSDDFALKAKGKGTVIKVTDSEVIIKYNDNKTPVVINYDKYALHSSKDLITEQEPTVKEGQKVQEGDILVASKEFFKNNNLAQGINLYTLIAPYGMWNFEDGMVISEQCAGKMSSHHGDVVVVNVKENEAITRMVELGSDVKTNTPLVIKTGMLTESDLHVVLPNSKQKGLLEFDEEDFDDSADIGGTIDGDSEDFDNSMKPDNSDEDENEFGDQFAKKVYPHINGQVYDIQIFAKDEKVLDRYPVAKKTREAQIEELKAKISEYEKEKFDSTRLKEKLNRVVNCFGKTYKTEPVDNLLIIYKVHGFKGLHLGDKLHNRNGKVIAA